MQKRNPIFVAGFPYLLITLGYMVMFALDLTGETTKEVPDSALFPMFGSLIMILVGLGYTIYWLASTAKVLRRKTKEKIPTSLLIVIPIASYWWMWRYSKAVEAYTHGKSQTALTFVLLVLLGPIGMGILQDIYNKLSANKHTNPES